MRKRRIALLLVIFLFLTANASAKTWYVDDSGNADFTKISDAIKAAKDGDTIIVRDGYYREYIQIKKSITIKSENGPDRTTIDGSVDIYSDHVTVAGFDVHCACVKGCCGFFYNTLIDCICVKGSYCKIFNNTIRKGNILIEADYCEVFNSKIIKSWAGVYLKGSRCEIYNNMIEDAETGIYLSGHQNKIFNNKFINVRDEVVAYFYYESHQLFSNPYIYIPVILLANVFMIFLYKSTLQDRVTIKYFKKFIIITSISLVFSSTFTYGFAPLFWLGSPALVAFPVLWWKVLFTSQPHRNVVRLVIVCEIFLFFFLLIYIRDIIHMYDLDLLDYCTFLVTSLFLLLLAFMVLLSVKSLNSRKHFYLIILLEIFSLNLIFALHSVNLSIWFPGFWSGISHGPISMLLSNYYDLLFYVIPIIIFLNIIANHFQPVFAFPPAWLIARRARKRIEYEEMKARAIKLLEELVGEKK